MVLLLVLLITTLTVPTMAQTIIFDNFVDGPSDRWELIKDNVMGGISDGELEFKADKNYNYARMTGTVKLENNGGFIQFRRKLHDYLDRSNEGLELEVRGNDQKYFVHIRTSGTFLPWQYYEAPFFAKNDWRNVKLLFSKFQPSSIWLSNKLTAKNIRSIGIVAIGKEQKVQIDVKNISFF